MLPKAVLLLLICSFSTIVNASMLLWSTQELKLSPLQEFSTEEFSEIIKKSEKADVFVFESQNRISTDIQPILKGFFSQYIPNGFIESENATEFTGNTEQDIQILQETIGNSKNFISVIVAPSIFTRSRRQVESSESDVDQSGVEPSLKGPVIFRKAKMTNKENDKLYAILYSSKPLLFRRNDTDPTDIYLDNTDEDMIIYDTRLNVKIPLKDRGKITLRFSFTWQNGYWYMPSVKIETQGNKEYNLISTEDVFAQEYFSYHCNGETVFKDNTGTELYLYDLQVQIDSKNGKFGDVNDCVPFITVPIWSGIFITFLLGIGMVIALTAIMDIKTMDKIDNYRIKNLPITVSD